MMGAFATGAGGCWLALIQLAPVALQAAGDVGSGALHTAANVARVAQGKDDDAPTQEEMDRPDVCEQLQQKPPGVIELRNSAAGAPEYRDLRLTVSTDEAQWTAEVDTDTATGGWRPAVNLLDLNFKPPLTGALAEQELTYLAYLPADSKEPSGQDPVTELKVNFGTTIGTFNWSGRPYDYAVTGTLPCFPPP
jgi:hypothetical protein